MTAATVARVLSIGLAIVRSEYRRELVGELRRKLEAITGSSSIDAGHRKWLEANDTGEPMVVLPAEVVDRIHGHLIELDGYFLRQGLTAASASVSADIDTIRQALEDLR